MHIKIERNALIASLSRASMCAPTKSTVPVLASVLISADKGTVSFTANDLETYLTDVSACDVVEPGQTLAPAATLLDIAKKLSPGNEIDIQSGAGEIIVTVGRYKTHIRVMDTEDFPMVAAGGFDCTFTIPANVLKSSIGKVTFAMSSEETRYYLCGVHVHTEDDRLKFVATDGHRLAVSRIILPDMEGALPDGIIIPRKLVNDVVRLLTGQDEVTVSMSDNRVQFDFGYCRIGGKLIDGAFPEYKRVIPMSNEIVATVSAHGLSEAVARVAAVSKDKTRAVKFLMQPGEIVLGCSDSEGDTASDGIDADYSGDKFDIGFQARYVTDVLTNVSGNAVIKFRDSGTAAVVRDSSDEDVLFVIMPTRI